MQKILNRINAFICIIDVQNLKILWSNRYSNTNLGLTLPDMLNMSSDELLSLIHPDYREFLITGLKDITFDINGYEYIFIKIRTKDGQWKWVLSTNTVFERNTDGKICKVLSFATAVDIKKLHNQMKAIDHEDTDRSLPISKLSEKERKIIELISIGKTDKDISVYLGISIFTAKTHRKRIIRKLGLKNSSNLIKYAVENGLC